MGLKVLMIGTYPIEPGVVHGGVESATSTLVPALAERDDIESVTVLRFHNGEAPAACLNETPKVQIHYVRGQSRWRLITGSFLDVRRARKLIAEKAELRGAELSAAERHLERLREGRPESLETTSLHLDVLRDLKRIHSHICSVAYPVLDAAGEMAIADVAESDPITLASPGSRPAT